MRIGDPGYDTKPNLKSVPYTQMFVLHGHQNKYILTQYFLQFWETEALWITVTGNSNFLRTTPILWENSKIAPLKECGEKTHTHTNISYYERVKCLY